MDLTRWLRAQWDRVAAWVLIVAGLVSLLVGWLGVSSTGYLAEQIPYLVSGGIGGMVQDAALSSLDQIACHFGSSREQLVLALASDKEARRYKREHGVDPRKAGNLLQGLIGG